MNLAQFPFGPPLPPLIVKKVIVKIGHSIDTLLPYRNSEQNYMITLFVISESYERKMNQKNIASNAYLCDN